MASETRVTDPGDLYLINRLVHDYWFDIDGIMYDPERRTLQVRFLRPSAGKEETIGRLLFLRRVRVPITEWLLEIRNVESYTVRETEHTRRYDFNEVQFSEATGKLTLTTGVPLVFEVFVRPLDIEIRDTGNVIRDRVRITI